MGDGAIKQRLRDVFGLSDAELSRMSSLDMWMYSYRHEKPNDHLRPKASFTGFDSRETEALQLKAETLGFQVMSEIHRDLSFLVSGPDPDKWSLAQAKKREVPVVQKEDFLKFMEELDNRE